MNREPETYDELILQKKCIELTKYYNLTMEQLEEIYEFLKKIKKEIFKEIRINFF